MTFRMKTSYLYKVAVILFLALALGSCMELEEHAPAVGYLEFPVLSVDTEVEDLACTKVTPEGFVFGAPDLSTVNVAIFKEGETAVFKTINATENLTPLPVGNYVLRGSYASNGFGKPYFVGETTVEISGGQTTTAAFALALANSIVRVKVGSSLVNDFTGETVSFSAMVGGTELSGTADCGEWAYVPSGTDITVKLAGTNSIGRPATFTHVLTSPAAKTAYEVVCEKDATDWPVITIPEQQDGAWANRLYITPGATCNYPDIPLENISYQVSASSSDWSSAVSAKQVDGYHVVDGLANGGTYYVRAYVGNIYSEPMQVTVRNDNPLKIQHRYPNNELSGTDVSIDYGFKGILKTLADNGLLVVNSTLSDSSTDFRSADGSFGTMTEAAGWPYIPEGNSYSLSFSHKLSSETSVVTSGISGISVPKPVFTVTLGQSYSSYDYGTEAGANANGFYKDTEIANGLNPETIFAVSASYSGISASLLNNSNYTRNFQVQLDGVAKAASSTVQSLDLGNITGLSTWKAYTLKAVTTFAGSTIETSRTHHITGLPYKVAPPKTTGTHAWSGSATNNSDNIQLFGFKEIYSPAFHIPADVNVSVSALMKLKANSWLAQQVACYLKIGSSSLYTTEACSSTSEKEYRAVNVSGTFTTAQKSLTIDSDSISGKSYTKVFDIKILYR